jgi:hypothetical protein
LGPGAKDWQAGVFRIASRGFTPAQREFLKAIADNTALEEFRIFARASAADIPGAFWDIDPTANVRWFDLPIPKFGGFNIAASANLAQAALDLEAGNRAGAERRLRENLSAGFLLMESAHTAIETIVAANRIAAMRPVLAAFFEATGRARDAGITADAGDATPSPDATTRPGVLTPDEQAREIRRAILNENELPGIRWESLMVPFAIEPCTDMHQIVFGADSLQRLTLAAAKHSMAKRGSDSLLFTLVERANGVVPPAASAATKATEWTKHRTVARLFSALTGSRQLEACLLLLP